MTTTFTNRAPKGDFEEWVSPNGVTHLIDGAGYCITCGKAHPDEQDSRVIAAECYVRTRFYPPLPYEYGRYAVDAVDACNDGDYQREIPLDPDLPIHPRQATRDESGSVSCSAEGLIDALRLWHMVEEEA